MSALALNLAWHQSISKESALHTRWPKYWSFSFSISPSNEHSGLISFRIDWFDLLVVQGTLKSLLQHHSSKASILQWSTSFMVPLSIRTWLLEKPSFWLHQPLLAKGCLYNMLSRVAITFLSRSKCLSISWLQSPSAVIFRAQENKVYHCFHLFSCYLPWRHGTGCHDLHFMNVEI